MFRLKSLTQFRFSSAALLRRPASGLTGFSRMPPPARGPSGSSKILETGPIEAPPAPLGLTEEQSVGRDLAKLAAMSRAVREAIATAGAAGDFNPDLLVQLEKSVVEANTLISTALDIAGHPCTLSQIADRVNVDVVSIPKGALDFRNMLTAMNLRDELEMAMVHMNYPPPKEALIDGSGKPFNRLERIERKRRKFQDLDGDSYELTASDGDFVEDGMSSPTTRVSQNALSKFSAQELEKRKAAMIEANNIRTLLRGFDTALLDVGRVHKVTKGGTSMSMRALVIIGNRAGAAGYGEGKSETVAHAIERACRDATRNLMYIDRYQDRTIYHRAVGEFVCSRVSLWPAPMGRGISANNNFAAVFQLFGIKDVGAKLHGPRSIANSVKALFNGLAQVRSAEEITGLRGLRLATGNESVSRTGIVRGKQKVRPRTTFRRYAPVKY